MTDAGRYAVLGQYDTMLYKVKVEAKVTTP